MTLGIWWFGLSCVDWYFRCLFCCLSFVFHGLNLQKLLNKYVLRWNHSVSLYTYVIVIMEDWFCVSSIIFVLKSRVDLTCNSCLLLVYGFIFWGCALYSYPSLSRWVICQQCNLVVDSRLCVWTSPATRYLLALVYLMFGPLMWEGLATCEGACWEYT